MDFGSLKTVNEIHVFTLQDNYANSAEPTESMTFTLWGLTAFALEYWNGSSWVAIRGASVSGNNKIWRKFTFTPINTSKIRVQTTASMDGYSRITEVEAYGPAESSGAGSFVLINDPKADPSGDILDGPITVRDSGGTITTTNSVLATLPSVGKSVASYAWSGIKQAAHFEVGMVNDVVPATKYARNGIEWAIGREFIDENSTAYKAVAGTRGPSKRWSQLE